MNTKMRHELGSKAARLAALIVQAKPAQMRFRSEEQFLQMLQLPQDLVPVPVPVERRSHRS